MDIKEYQEKYREENKERLKNFRKEKWKKIKSNPELLKKYREYQKEYARLHRNDERIKLQRKKDYKKIKENPFLLEKYNRIRNEWRTTPSGIYTSLKNRGRHDFNLKKEDFLEWYEKQEKKCVYCGLTLEEIRKLPFPYNRKNGKNKYSIDRKDSSRGYFLDNMTLSCFTCNTIKNNFLTFEEMKKVGEIIITPKLRNLLEQ